MIETVSTISNFVLTGVEILGENLVIDGRSSEDLMIEAVSTISNLTLPLNMSLFKWT